MGLYPLLSGWLLATVTLADDQLNSRSPSIAGMANGRGSACHRPVAGHARPQRTADWLTPQSTHHRHYAGAGLPVLGLYRTEPAGRIRRPATGAGRGAGLRPHPRSAIHTTSCSASCWPMPWLAAAAKPRLLPLPAAALLAALALAVAVCHLSAQHPQRHPLRATDDPAGRGTDRLATAPAHPAGPAAGCLAAGRRADRLIRLAYQADQRWATFRESTQLALDTQTHRAGCTPDMPPGH